MCVLLTHGIAAGVLCVWSCCYWLCWGWRRGWCARTWTVRVCGWVCSCGSCSRVLPAPCCRRLPRVGEPQEWQDVLHPRARPQGWRRLCVPATGVVVGITRGVGCLRRIDQRLTSPSPASHTAMHTRTHTPRTRPLCALVEVVLLVCHSTYNDAVVLPAWRRHHTAVIPFGRFANGVRGGAARLQAKQGCGPSAGSRRARVSPSIQVAKGPPRSRSAWRRGRQSTTTGGGSTQEALEEIDHRPGAAECAHAHDRSLLVCVVQIAMT